MAEKPGMAQFIDITKVSNDGWRDRENGLYIIHTYNGVLFNQKNEGSSPIHDNMDGT